MQPHLPAAKRRLQDSEGQEMKLSLSSKSGPHERGQKMRGRQGPRREESYLFFWVFGCVKISLHDVQIWADSFQVILNLLKKIEGSCIKFGLLV